MKQSHPVTFTLGVILAFPAALFLLYAVYSIAQVAGGVVIQGPNLVVPGNVGIGTDPKVKLDVAGDINSPGLSASVANAVAHGHLSGASRDDVSVIVLPYTSTIVSSASADAACATQINSAWEPCGVVKENYFNQGCETYRMLSSFTYITFVRTESIAGNASAWTNCQLPGHAYLACSPSCPSF